MVERAGLENRCRCKPTVGSNPTSSAVEYRRFEFHILIRLFRFAHAHLRPDRTCGERKAPLRWSDGSSRERI